MHVTKAMIHPELRKAGAGIRLVFSGFSKRTFRVANFVMRAMKGRCKIPLRYEQIFLPRDDGSLLRLCVYSPVSPREGVPGLLWLHGGGYAMGCPEQDEKNIRFMTQFLPWLSHLTSPVAGRAYPAAWKTVMPLLWLKANASSTACGTISHGRRSSEGVDWPLRSLCMHGTRAMWQSPIRCRCIP